MQSLALTQHLEHLEMRYQLRERENVIGFLEQHAFLLPVLVELNAPIQRYFPGAVCALEVFHDPDSPDHAQLLVAIGTPLPADEALNRLDELDANWWHANRQRTQRKLVIDTEFQRHEL